MANEKIAEANAEKEAEIKEPAPEELEDLEPEEQESEKVKGGAIVTNPTTGEVIYIWHGR